MNIRFHISKYIAIYFHQPEYMEAIMSVHSLDSNKLYLLSWNVYGCSSVDKHLLTLHLDFS